MIIRRSGVDTDALAERLQREGADSFTASWRALLGHIAVKASTLAQVAQAGVR
jgi:hypothetical protein